MSESMKGLKRTHRCAELNGANVGETAVSYTHLTLPTKLEV